MIVWLASYPKSGNTWVRFFILSLILGNKKNINLNHLKAISQYPSKSQYKDIISDYLNLNEVAKNWKKTQTKINSDKKVRFFKTHNMLVGHQDNFFTDYTNTLASIYIIRDPRNVITSLKHHFSLDYNKSKEFLFNENQIITLSDQEKEKTMGEKNHQLPQIIGSWQLHYRSWKSMKKNFLLIKYENLIKNPKEEFFKISFFVEKILKTKFTEEQINNAIESSSFLKLKKMEDDYGFVESAENKKGGKKNFFNLGPKNDWTKLLDKKIADEIASKFKNEMKELGYL